MKFGEYQIPAGASMREILELLNRGGNVLRQVVVPEGLTSWQVVELLKGEEGLTGEVAEVPAEGSLAPAGYDFQRGVDRTELLGRMEERQREVVAAAWEGRAAGLPLESPEELLTLASIVEKETGVPEERPRVAQVFVNRLKKGMRLQTDPTVIYGITKGEGPLGRGLRASELAVATPYNTYVRPGLPPGPIANPGAEAIEAAANPEPGDYLYFVADGSGGHAFAKTLEEHNRNALALARWLAKDQRVADVLHPGLESHPQHDLARRQMTGYGGTFSFRLRGGEEAAHRLLGGVRLFTLAESLGGVESLIGYPKTMTHASVPADRLRLR